MRINNAFVEDVSCFNNSNGSILVSYSVPEINNTISIQTIRLNLSNQTIVVNSFGQSICLCCIQRGSVVNVAFSPVMTASIPPQSNAFWVAVQQSPIFPIPWPPVPPRPPQPPRLLNPRDLRNRRDLRSPRDLRDLRNPRDLPDLLRDLRGQ